ncbi:MAG: Mur ligase family protein [Acidobacteriota bacterium]
MTQSRNPSTLDIYCIAIGGTGMAPLACLLQDEGHRVRGVDGKLYPPMSTLLEGAGIVPLEGFDAAHLSPAPDLVVVGNAVPRTNPEAQEADRLGLERISMPQALARFFLDGRRPLVVAGTHGKTTTTAMAAWVFSACGTDPGYLVGGVPRNLERSFHRGNGMRFILEGDEYNAAYFDRGAKFLHYQPETLLLTSVEHDHVDLYPTAQSLEDAYARLIALLPADGLLVACGDSDEIRILAADSPARVVFYGLTERNDVHPKDLQSTPAGMSFTLVDRSGNSTVEIHLTLPMWGDYNVGNALAVWTAARRDGIAPDAIRRALASFQGVKRRQEEVGGGGGVLVVDDFAHHPTAVGKTLDGLRQHYPGRRLVALFEPRSLTAGREFFFAPYVEAFERADRVHFAPTFHAARLTAEERLDLPALAAALGAKGTPATAYVSIDELLDAVIEQAQPGDVLVTMSSGSFSGAPQRLAAALASRD